MAMTEIEAVTLFKCLADRTRLQILKSLAQEDMYVERLSERLGVTPPTISFHLKKLSERGLVRAYKSQYYTMYSLVRDELQVTILELLRESEDEEELLESRELNYRKKVLDAFFEYGKLKAIPAQRKKERIVLEEIAKVFEPGRSYTEREVNLLIADFHDDFCTIRRDMIAEKLLAREGTTYWRLTD